MPFDSAYCSHRRLSCPSTLPFGAVILFDPAFQFCLLALQEAARRAHERLAAEENRELMMAKAQRNQEEEQYAKDITRMEQQTEVHTIKTMLQIVPYPVVEQQREIWNMATSAILSM